MGKQKHKPAVASPVKDKKTPPRKVVQDNDEDSSSSSSSSEEEVGKFFQQTPVKKNAAATKQPAQKQTPKFSGPRRTEESSSDEEEESDSDDTEDVPKQTKQVSAQKKQSIPQLSPKATKAGRKASTDEESSSEEDDDSEEETTSEKTKQKPLPQKQPVLQVGTKATGQKTQVAESSSEEEDDSDEDDSDEDDNDEEKEGPKGLKQIPPQKKQVHQVGTKAVAQKTQVVESSSEDDDSDEDDSEVEKEAPKAVKQIPPQKKVIKSVNGGKTATKTSAIHQMGTKPVAQKTQVAESSSEEDDSDEDDSEVEKEAPKAVKQIPPQKKDKQDSDSDEDEESEEEEESEVEEDKKETIKVPVTQKRKGDKVNEQTAAKKQKLKGDKQDSDSDEDEEESEDTEESEEAEEKEETIKVTVVQKRKGDKVNEQTATKKQKLKGEDSNEKETLKMPGSRKRKKEQVKKDAASKQQKLEAVNGSEGTITLYVGHLDKGITDVEITSFFSKNNISVVEVRKQPTKNNAFVDLKDADDLQDALALNGSKLKNTIIAVEKAKPRTPAPAKKEKQNSPSISPGNTNLGSQSNKSSRNEKDSRTLFVKNLPDTVTSEGLKSIFDSAVDIRIPNKDGVKKGFGFIEFADIKTMETAMSENQGVEFEGSSLFLDYMGSRSNLKSPGGKQGRGGGRQGSSGTRGESKVLFVKNLSYSTDESSLKTAFKGAVSARIPTFQDSGKSKGYAFVDFPTAEAAAKAFDTMSGQAVDGRQVTLDFAVDKAAAGAGGRGGFSPRGRGGKSGGKSFRGGAAGGQKGKGGLNKAKGGIVQSQGKKTTFNEDSN